jgi:hypothetical protein
MGLVRSAFLFRSGSRGKEGGLAGVFVLLVDCFVYWVV